MFLYKFLYKLQTYFLPILKSPDKMLRPRLILYLLLVLLLLLLVVNHALAAKNRNKKDMCRYIKRINSQAIFHLFFCLILGKSVVSARQNNVGRSKDFSF